MHTHQRRDSRGHFTRVSTPPPQEEPTQPMTTPATTSHISSHLQRLFDIARAPLLSAVPLSEQIAHVATAAAAYTYSPSNSQPPSPPCFVPLPHYTTETPILHPTFNAAGSDDSELQNQLQAPAAILLEFDLEAQQPTNLVDSNISSDDEPFEILLPPQPLPRTPPQVAQPQPLTRLAGSSPPLPPIPQPPPTMACTSAQGIAAMLSPCDKTAPYFSGEVDIKIEDFLKEYEELADGCGLSERQKVETIIWYVKTDQRYIWMTLPGFVRHDWDDLCHKLCKEYISPTAQGRFSKQKLVELTNRSAGLPMEEETDVINYHHEFNTLSKPLLEAGRITTSERNAFFWHSFHPEDRQALRERLIAKQPDRPKGQAFDLQDVLDTAIAIFSGDDDLLFQEPPPQRHKADHAQERRTGHTAQGLQGMSRAVLAPPSLSYKPITSAPHDRGNISHDPTCDSSRDPFATCTSRDLSACDPGNL